MTSYRSCPVEFEKDKEELVIPGIWTRVLAGDDQRRKPLRLPVHIIISSDYNHQDLNIYLINYYVNEEKKRGSI